MMMFPYNNFFKICGLISLLFTLTVTFGQAFAADISGTVTDEQGSPLPRATLCLQQSDSINGCMKLTNTDKNGNYIFRSIKKTGIFSVKIYNKKNNLYPTYVWAPPVIELTVESSRDDIVGVDFVGSFGFSNYQNTYQLTGNDFPELRSFDVSNPEAYVHLKVYTADTIDAPDQNLLFLGVISSVDNIAIEVSLPLDVDQVHYQIYDAFGQSVQGSILLADLS